VQSSLRTLAGFVEGFLFEKKDGESRYNFLTTAVWESDEALINARKAVSAEFHQRGFDPEETRKKLGIDAVRSIDERTAY
jgi:heme-degrading monooxygenase HmoA